MTYEVFNFFMIATFGVGGKYRYSKQGHFKRIILEIATKEKYCY
jgi:hypothetical protein